MDVYDWDGDGSHDLIGSTTTTATQLTEGSQKQVCMLTYNNIQPFITKRFFRKQMDNGKKLKVLSDDKFLLTIPPNSIRHTCIVSCDGNNSVV